MDATFRMHNLSRADVAQWQSGGLISPMSQVRIPPSAPLLPTKKTDAMPYRAQSANRLTERIHATVRSAMERADVSSLLVACSGGADSTCLLHAVVRVAQRTGKRVAAGHVRHGVRVDDGSDAEAVCTLAECLGVPSHVVSLNLAHTENGHSPTESDMRTARYRALAAVAADIHADVVLTGHTLDDQAETTLLHLMRGAGVDGLGGMAEETLLPLSLTENNGSYEPRVRLIRPLLFVRHEETVAYCTAHDLAVMQDPTNDDQRYTRNWLRHTVLPALGTRNPDIAFALARAATTMRDDAAFLAEQTAHAIAHCDCQTDQAYVSISLRAFSSEHVAMQRRMLRTLIERLTGAVPRAADIDALRGHVTTSRSTVLRHFGGVACCLAFDRIVLGCDRDVRRWVYRAASARFPLSDRSGTLAEDACVHLRLCDQSMVSYTLRLVDMRRFAQESPGCEESTTLLRLPGEAAVSIRLCQSADRFWPPTATRPLPLRDYLRARGVPAPVRDWLPLLVVNDTIAWVIGHEVGREFVATEATATHCGILTRAADESDERAGKANG